MSFIGDNGTAAPKLQNAALSSEELQVAFEQCVQVRISILTTEDPPPLLCLADIVGPLEYFYFSNVNRRFSCRKLIRDTGKWKIILVIPSKD